MPPGRGHATPSKQKQRWEMLLGILGFFTVAALITTVVAELRGEPALTEVVVLVLFLVATYATYRAWRRSP
jgi:hypothetical protein